MKRIDEKWINWTEILTYGELINICVADRDVGKSYGMLYRAITRCQKRGKAMVWLRRTDEECKNLLESFGNGKWLNILSARGLTPDNVTRQGHKILYRAGKGESWQPLIRYGSLSGWDDIRDTDDPREEVLFIDEAFATIEKHRRYNGDEVSNGLDIFKSLRKGDSDIRLIVCGNRERQCNIWADYFGIYNPPTADGIYRVPTASHRDAGIGANRCVTYTVCNKVDKEHDDMKTLLTGTKYGVFLSGGSKSEYGALIANVPPRAWFYAAADFGRRVTLWAAPNGFIYCSFRPGGTRVIRPTPDGRPDTVVMCPDIRKRLTLLRSAWNRGRVRFDSPKCAEIMMAVIPRLI
ncbi:MAG: phage DNA encapsidation protein [Eubacteriales bacterium]